MKSIKRFFTIIELVTASTLMLILFMIIGFVFGSVSEVTATLNDKISEGLMANHLFSKMADDLEASYPVFYTGDRSDGKFVKISEPAAGNPLGPLLPTGNAVGGKVAGTKILNSTHNEIIRCVTTNHTNGGLLNSNGFESMNLSDNVDQSDKPVRFVTYNFAGIAEVIGGHPPRSIYRRDFPLRPDLRKKDTTVRGGYAVGNFVKVGLPGDGESVSSNPADGDINEITLVEGIWEVRVEFLETDQSADVISFSNKVLVRVTIEFAFTDISKQYNDPSRYTQYSVADLAPVNGKSDRLEHTYTTVIVVNRNNWER